MIRSIFLTALLAGVLLGAGTAKADPVVLRLTPQSQVLEAGQSGSVSLVLDDSLTVRTAQIILQGDPAIITEMECSPGALFEAQMCSVWEGSEELEPGVWFGYGVIMGGDCEGLGPGELLRWDFVAGAEGMTNLINIEAKLYDGDGVLLSDISVQAPAEIRVGEFSSTPPLTNPFHLTHHPNPFNPTTTLSFTLPEPQSARITIYDINGRLVRTLLDEHREQGIHEVVWNGRGDDGRLQASGMYFSRIEAGPHCQVRKVILAK